MAVSAGIALYMDWRLFALLLGVYILAFLLLKTASIASLSGVTCMPLVMAILGGFSVYQYICAIVSMLFVWIMHRQNLVRIAHHEEKKFSLEKSKSKEKSEFAEKK